MKLGELIHQVTITESYRPRDKAKAEIRAAKAILTALERDLAKTSASSSQSDKNRIGQHLDEATFAIERASKAIADELGR